MKYLAFAALTALAACGVDGPPERPVVVQEIMPADAPATFTDQNGIVRTTGKSTSVGVDPAGL